MLIQLNNKQIKLKNELQEYFEDLITPALKAELNQPEYFEGGGPEFKKVMRTMGSDGWIGLSWKKEFGGKELSPIEQYIFVETVMRTGFPFPFLTMTRHKRISLPCNAIFEDTFTNVGS